MTTNYSLTAAPGFAYCAQWQISITWSVNGVTPSDSDYIAMYLVGGQTEVWRLVTGGVEWGSANLDAPTTPGHYEFRYCDGATNAVKGSSNTVDVEYPMISINCQSSTVVPYQILSV